MNIIINLLRDLARFLIDMALWLFGIARMLILNIWEWFLHIPFSEKIVVLSIIPSFFAAAMPSAKFMIFENWFEISNPLSVYIIGIYALMIITSFYRNNITFAGRILVNLWFLGWVIYIHLSGDLTKARPFEMTNFYYFNYIIPFMNISGTLLSRFIYLK